MKTAGDYLAEGFRQAFAHPQYIALDVAARAMRSILALVLALFAFSATLAQIPASEAEALLIATGATGVPDLAAFVILASLVAHADLLAANLTIGVLLTVVFWVLIEGLSRGLIVGLTALPRTKPGRRSTPDGEAARVVILSVLRNLASGITTRLVLGAAAIFIGLVTLGPVLAAAPGEWTPTEVWWPFIAGIFLIGLVAFSLKILDTLARLGALDLLGTSLPEILLVSAMPALISAAVWAAALALGAGLWAQRALDPLIALGILLVASTLTSAMILVRYGSVQHIYQDLIRSEQAH